MSDAKSRAAAPGPDTGSARPRFVSRSLTPGQRRIYLAVVAWFALVSVSMTWPGYTLFNRIRPLVLGMPLSLFWLAALVVGSFLVGVALLRWELRHGLIDRPEAPLADSGPSDPPAGDGGGR